jgi:hypothetical protein
MTLFFLPLFSFVDVAKTLGQWRNLAIDHQNKKTLLPTQQHLQNESKVSKPAPKVLYK